MNLYVIEITVALDRNKMSIGSSLKIYIKSLNSET